MICRMVGIEPTSLTTFTCTASRFHPLQRQSAFPYQATLRQIVVVSIATEIAKRQVF